MTNPERVSYDFDECLCIPNYQEEGFLWVPVFKPLPNKKLVKQIREDAKTKTVYIVTFRRPEDIPEVLQFIKDFDIPILPERVLSTNMQAKSATINKHLISRHYDDRVDVCVDIKMNCKNCVPVLVVPKRYVASNSTNSLFELFTY